MTEDNGTIDIPQDTQEPLSQTVVGIRFRNCGKIYTFDVDDIEVFPGSRVVVETDMGLSLGRVVTPRQIREKRKEPLKRVIRVATEEDFDAVKANKSLEDEARQYCIEKAKDLNLPMKIVYTETTLDKKRLIFYFTADGRIDFRELVRDLAARFKTRIEMRQIGVRDEVKLLGGFGVCGRQTCCSLFLTAFEPITIRMAKQQALSINQSKLSGVCGRLMCCLGYEYRSGASEEKTPAPAQEPLVTLTEAGAEIAPPLEDAEGVVADSETLVSDASAPGAPAGAPPPVPGEKGPAQQPSEQYKRPKRQRRRKKKPRQPGAAPEESRAKPQQAVPAPAEKQEGTQGRGRPFNKRRKFWKKKKP
ncbi:MAG: stage 0 sporulation family protein [Nitrospiraceae bacterium]|nr:MAG: stage 0 sporulation family protein [Nitrospiraceae bacterium]